MSCDPRPYKLSDPSEMQRLLRELEGYMRISKKPGTDTKGREYAYEALKEINEARRREENGETALFGVFEPSV